MKKDDQKINSPHKAYNVTQKGNENKVIHHVSFRILIDQHFSLPAKYLRRYSYAYSQTLKSS